MTIDHNLVYRAEMAATGANVHKLNALKASYLLVCIAHDKDPDVTSQTHVAMRRRALELGLEGMSEHEACAQARKEFYP